MRRHRRTQSEQALLGCEITPLYSQPQNVGVELLAHCQEVAHERPAQLTCEETHRLEAPRERHAVDWAAERPGVEYLKYDGAQQSVDAERQANGHERLRTPEVRARPC